MISKAKSIAFFDIDYTLVNGYTALFTARELIRRKILKKHRLLMALYYRIIDGLFKHVDVRTMYQIILNDLVGRHYDEMMEIGRHIFDHDLKPRLYQEGLEEIKKRKQEGSLIVFLSSGPYLCIKNMEIILGADFSFSNRPVITKGILQKEIHEPICYRDGKLQLARKLASEKCISLEDCAFYSDGFSDLPLLEQVGDPVVVNPDRHLNRVALKNNWKIRQFVKTLGNQSL